MESLNCKQLYFDELVISRSITYQNGDQRTQVSRQNLPGIQRPSAVPRGQYAKTCPANSFSRQCGQTLIIDISLSNDR